MAKPAETESSLAPFRDRAFAVLWAATVVSNIGTWMQGAAVGHDSDSIAGAYSSGLRGADMKMLQAMFGAVLLIGWAHAAEPTHRLVDATYVPLPKPRTIVERPLTEANWCANAIAVLLNPRADEPLRTATLEKARNRRCVN
jgi:Transmembrane secretion effector